MRKSLFTFFFLPPQLCAFCLSSCRLPRTGRGECFSQLFQQPPLPWCPVHCELPDRLCAADTAGRWANQEPGLWSQRKGWQVENMLSVESPTLEILLPHKTNKLNLPYPFPPSPLSTYFSDISIHTTQNTTKDPQPNSKAASCCLLPGSVLWQVSATYSHWALPCLPHQKLTATNFSCLELLFWLILLP